MVGGCLAQGADVGPLLWSGAHCHASKPCLSTCRCPTPQVLKAGDLTTMSRGSQPSHLVAGVGTRRGSARHPPLLLRVEREFSLFIDNLLVRIHLIIVMIRRTGLAPWEFEFPFPGSLTSTFRRCRHWSRQCAPPSTSFTGRPSTPPSKVQPQLSTLPERVNTSRALRRYLPAPNLKP